LLNDIRKEEEQMIDIIVVGYPKSGTTWVVRLVAELVRCPVAGFLGSDHNEIAREGLDRDSDYRCFKAHHQFNELLNIKTNNTKIIYVIRDPRDVCLSGSRYFVFDRFPLLRRCMNRLPMGGQIYAKIDKHLITTSNYRIEQMVNAVIYGSRKVHKWVRIPWINHYKPYMENNCFFVRYEDLLDHAELECKRILSFLEVERDEQKIKDAIEKQSFRHKKDTFFKAGMTQKAAFLKVGEKEQWRKGLSKKQKRLFNKILADDLKQLGYESF
jgi:hypothetical protein